MILPDTKQYQYDILGNTHLELLEGTPDGLYLSLSVIL